MQYLLRIYSFNLVHIFSLLVQCFLVGQIAYMTLFIFLRLADGNYIVIISIRFLDDLFLAYITDVSVLIFASLVS